MSSQNDEIESIECPICFNKFFPNMIENHVNKCLFLNESSSKNEETPKRGSSSKGNDLSVKRPKYFLQSQNCSETATQHQSNDVHDKIEYEPPHTVSSKNTKINIVQEELLPLAERMRPLNIISYVGQTHAIGQQSILYKSLSRTEIPNIILWGPPGCGKTSLANIIENVCKHCPNGKYRFIKLSAAISGVNDVKKVIVTASNDLKFGRRTVIFLDEIHRFNKTQQDIFLPHLESGTITLIGATTENPSYTLNSALLSRCQVIVLEKLSVDDLIVILKTAVKTLKGLIIDESSNDNLNSSSALYTDKKFCINEHAIKWLAETSDGDARIALGSLELAIQHKIHEHNNGLPIQMINSISLDNIKESLKKTHMLYDKKGDQHYDIISALHKSLRSSNENASLYWLTRMIVGGEDPVYIARRLVRAASEDIGLADPKALGIAVQTMQACKMLGTVECDVILAQCVTYLARASKSRLMDESLNAARNLNRNYKDVQPVVPIHISNFPTNSNIHLGHWQKNEGADNNESEKCYLPEEIGNVDFFNEE